MEVSVIVPARNCAATLPRTLEHLLAQDASFDYEVLVVDDGSTDATAALVSAAGGPVRLVRQSSAGAAAARNRGVAESRGRVLAFTDADCFPAAGWLTAGLGALAHAGLVQGRVVADPAAAAGPFDRSLWVTRAAGLWETANLFVTREAFDRAGGFEDWLGLASGRPMAEDVWLGWRVKRLGVASGFCEDALVHHAVFGRGPREYVAERLRLRHFPRMVAKMPELRDTFLEARVFLDRRSAMVDAALLAAVGAALTRRPWLMAAALPYSRLALRRALAHGPSVAAIDAVADMVGAGALLGGSVAARSPVI